MEGQTSAHTAGTDERLESLSPLDWRETVSAILEQIAERRNMSMTVFFREGTVSVSVYPYSENPEQKE